MTTGPRVPRVPRGTRLTRRLPGGMTVREYNAYVQRNKARKIAREAAQNNLQRRTESLSPSVQGVQKIRELQNQRRPANTGGAVRKWFNKIDQVTDPTNPLMGPIGNPLTGIREFFKASAAEGEISAGVTSRINPLFNQKQRQDIEDRRQSLLGLPKQGSSESFWEKEKARTGQPYNYLEASRQAYLDADIPTYKRIISEIATSPSTYSPFVLGKLAKAGKGFMTGLKVGRGPLSDVRKQALKSKKIKENFNAKQVLKYSEEGLNENPTLVSNVTDHKNYKSVMNAPENKTFLDNLPNWSKDPLSWVFGKRKRINAIEIPHEPKNRLRQAVSNFLKFSASEDSYVTMAMARLNEKINGKSLNQAFQRSGDNIGEAIRKRIGTAVDEPKGLVLDDNGFIVDVATGKLLKMKSQDTGKLAPINWTTLMQKAFKEDIFEEAKKLRAENPLVIKNNEIISGFIDFDASQLRKLLNPEFKKLDDTQIQFIARLQLFIEESTKQLELSKVDIGNYLEFMKPGEKYFPRVLNVLNKGIGSGKFAKKGFQKQRKIAEEDMYENVVNGKASYETDISLAMQHHYRSILKAVREKRLHDDMIAISKTKNAPLRYAGKGREREVVRNVIRKVSKLGSKAGITSKTINEIKETFPVLGRQLEDSLKRRSKTGKTKIFKSENAIDDWVENADKQLNYADISAEAGTIPGYRNTPSEMFKRIIFVGDDKTAQKNAEKFARQVGLTEPRGFVKFLQNVGAFGDVLRLGMTGFDLGFWMLQGFPALAKSALTGNPEWIKAWGGSVKQGVKSLLDPNSFDDFIIQHNEIIEEAVSNGLQIGRGATDIFEGFGVLGKIPKVGKGIATVGGRFEASFVNAGDIIRIKGYQALREDAILKAGNNPEKQAAFLQDTASFLNKLTGSLNSIEQGVSPSRRALERAFLFFSPRYTRASLYLVGDVLRRGVKGNEARKAIAQIAGFGLLSYSVLSQLAGEEPQLDPTKPGFMQIKIGEDYIGIGTIWIQMARLIGSSANDLDIAMTGGESELELERTKSRWAGDDMYYNNPIVRFARGRMAPLTGSIESVLTGKDYLGRELESGFAKFPQIVKSNLPIPFWMEGLIMGDHYGNKLSKRGATAEFFGGRVSQLSKHNLREIKRDELARANYSSDFDDLNKLQQTRLIKENKILQELDEEVREIYDKFPSTTDTQKQVETYYKKIKDINDDYLSEYEEIETHLHLEGNLPQFRKDLQDINKFKRKRWEVLRNNLKPDGELELAGTYFRLGEKRNPDVNIEDIAYQDFIDSVVANETFDKPGQDFDFKARDKAIEEFKSFWGTDTYNYVRAVLKEGQELPGLVDEFYNAREKYEWYWRESVNSVIARRPDSSQAEYYYDMWTSGDDIQKDEIEVIYPQIKQINKMIGNVRVQIRKENRGVDLFLYRWGYTTKFENKDNKDVINGRTQAREPFAMELTAYETGPEF